MECVDYRHFGLFLLAVEVTKAATGQGPRFARALWILDFGVRRTPKKSSPEKIVSLLRRADFGP